MRTRIPGVLLALLLAGCSEGSTSAADDDGPSAGASSTAPESEGSAPRPTPQCDEVWVDGGALPAAYRTCFDGESEVRPSSRPCSFGKPLLTHGDSFWAVRGGRITETDEARLLDDRRYRRVLAICTA